MKVEIKDASRDKQTMSLTDLILKLTELQKKYGNASLPVTIWMEPLIEGESHQISEGLSEIAVSSSGIHLLGRSFT